jgi:hypothetical protein
MPSVRAHTNATLKYDSVAIVAVPTMNRFHGLTCTHLRGTSHPGICRQLIISTICLTFLQSKGEATKDANPYQ